MGFKEKNSMVQFNTVEEALEELRQGKIILVTDDPERENEGDFICAAEFATAANVNFMATYGKGLICMPMAEEYVHKLKIPQMVRYNTDNHETAFTVSIDHIKTHANDRYGRDFRHRARYVANLVRQKRV